MSAIAAATCDNETSRRGATNTETALTHQSMQPTRRAGVSLPSSALFWSRVVHEGECWVWTGSRDTRGYGSFSHEGVKVRAHRYAYEDVVGSIPDGLVIDHLCRNTSCVRPDHLEPVTNRVNTLRGIGHAAVNVAKTECPRGHSYSDPANVSYYEGHRYCVPCRAADGARTVTCPDCGTPTRRTNLYRHRERSCPPRQRQWWLR